MTILTEGRGTASDVMEAFFEALSHVSPGGIADNAYFVGALTCFVRLRDREVRLGPVDRERLVRFRRDAATAMGPFADDIAAYVEITLVIVEGANDDEWLQLCGRRSVIQILIDDFDGTEATAKISRAVIAEIDVELRRVGLDQGPAPTEYVPLGMPEHHWWWSYPVTGAS